MSIEPNALGEPSAAFLLVPSRWNMGSKSRTQGLVLIEDQFTGLEISDDDVDQIEVVGDLIRHIEHG